VPITDVTNDEEFEGEVARRWLDCKIVGDAMSDAGESFDTVRAQYIHRNAISRRNLIPALYVYYQENFYGNGSKMNQSIVHATDGLVSYDWRGPLVLGVDGAVDANLTDYKRIIDGMSCYSGSGNLGIETIDRNEVGRQHAVKVTCVHDGSSHKPKLESVQIPKRHSRGGTTT